MTKLSVVTYVKDFAEFASFCFLCYNRQINLPGIAAGRQAHRLDEPKAFLAHPSRA
jgi:hypothetical protein